MVTTDGDTPLLVSPFAQRNPLPSTPSDGAAAPFDAVIGAARAGAEWALEILYRRFHPALLRYLRSHQPSEAEDLASEVWVAVAGALHRFEGGETDFRKWLFTIARRRVIDTHRQLARRRTAPAPMEAFDALRGRADPEGEAMSAIGADEALARITALLPRAQAEVVILRVLTGLGVEEVAAIMGRRPGAVRVLQHRALTRLAGAFPDESPRSAHGLAPGVVDPRAEGGVTR